MMSLLGLMAIGLYFLIRICVEAGQTAAQNRNFRHYNAEHNYNSNRQTQVEIDAIANPNKYAEMLGHPIDRTDALYYKKVAAEVLAREGYAYNKDPYNAQQYKASQTPRANGSGKITGVILVLVAAIVVNGLLLVWQVSTIHEAREESARLRLYSSIYSNRPSYSKSAIRAQKQDNTISIVSVLIVQIFALFCSVVACYAEIDNYVIKHKRKKSSDYRPKH